MKKYFLTSLLSLFLIAGTSVVLTANEENKKSKGDCGSVEMVQTAETNKSSCCSSSKTKATTASMTEAEAKSDCGSKTQQASSDDVQFIQTGSKSSAAGDCGSKATQTANSEGCSGDKVKATTASSSGCAGSKATQTANVNSDCGSKTKTVQTANSAPGECSKKPSGVATQQANNTQELK